MLQSDARSLRDSLGGALDLSGRTLWAADTSVALSDLTCGTSLGGRLAELRDRSVLVATGDQLTTALALIELDGVARRLILCPADLSAEYRSHVFATADVNAIVSDRDASQFADCNVALHVTCRPTIVPMDAVRCAQRQTEWIMLTSGTTGMPKMVVHSFASLTGAIKSGSNQETPLVWATFYDIRRYGGLQIFFRGILCGGSLVLSSAHEPVGDHLERLGARGVTHLSGTPSHWRRAIMSPSARAISPQYVRLSGEIADQAILDSLRSVYPQAKVAHAYASTEAGVGFEVNDGLEGFPANMIGPGTSPKQAGAVDMKVVDGSLRLRSSRAAARYLGPESPALLDADGFVDTGDLLELRGERYYFVGRRGGIINVGGLKVHPEEVEAVINRHPDVRMSLVRSRKNPITGAIVVADVVLRAETDSVGAAERAAELKREIMQACRAALSEHKVPASIRFVASLDVGATGKLARHHA
jgi:acyl-coenzyme A synthetase/AMP-(fatty) acid ligase